MATIRWIVLVLVVGFALAVLLLPAAPALTVASINTERVSYRVVDRTKAAFPITAMRVSAPGSSVDGRCLEGLLQPANGVDVTYGRTGDGPLEIWIDPSGNGSPTEVKTASLSAGEGGTAPTQLAGKLYLAADKGCGSEQVPRLPIWGIARFGEEFPTAGGPGRPVPKLLIKGTLKINARSRMRHVLYAVPEVTLPVGSRLEVSGLCLGPACNESEEELSGIWWGSVSVDRSSAALQVEAASQARELALYRPLRTDAEPISVSSLTQLMSDPDLIVFQFLLVFVTSLIGTVPEVAKHARDVLAIGRRRR